MSYGDAGGGTLTLSSPTHVHHVDVTSAVRSLRRSLSRSPSKFRLVTKSPSPSPQSPHESAPGTPPRRMSSQPLLTSSATHTPSPLVPFPPSVKLSLRSATRSKTTPTRPTRTSPRATITRALSQSSDNGNAMSSSSLSSSGSGQENSRSVSPAERRSFEKATKNMSLCNEMSASMNSVFSRYGDLNDNHPATTASPLKRSDAIMNLDQASLGSPVAKRRSLHGTAAFGHDFNVFDHGPNGAFEIHDDSNQSYELSSVNAFAPTGSESSLFTPSVPRRSSSLRKSTLQQRHGDKTSWGRRHAAQQLSHLSGGDATPSKSRPRLSLDQFMPPMPRESPFQNTGGLPNASIHTINNAPLVQPHPLSRTMTTSSSSSSMDDSPTHFPQSFNQNPRPKFDFSKSLPLGAIRPSVASISSSESGESFSTPKNYKSVKPLPAAFMSTGLISKVNKNPEQPLETRGGKSNVPDTPCKKHFNTFATYPAAIPGSAIAKARHIRHSFGTPSTPFNPHGNQPAFDKTNSVFGVFGNGAGSGRRGSFIGLGIDGDENDLDGKGEGQSGVDFDLPPTPTKAAILGSSSQNKFKDYPSGASPVLGFASLKPTRNSTSPLERIDFIERLSPRTPQDSVPDPSALSISAKRSDPGSMLPPATPTGGRDYFPKVNDRRLSFTPVHNSKTLEMDSNLLARFSKVELVGSGEFSEVYRVTQPGPAPDHSQSFTFTSAPQPTVSDRVFAVKKSRQSYLGVKDRERKLHEIEVLKAIGGSDHTIRLFDSWEDNNRLYMQTEYCEEGNLDAFLAYIGRKGRLDDFRIWKIMLEITLGLKHIHDSGFVHLDLKPANVFITFEGVLKIGDFGMAASWPTQPGIEGEGDREYIGPEILLGQYDKPADIFALGLIMLEMAGNVKLPDNGPTWQRLRSGDMSDVPSLTNSGSTTVNDNPSDRPKDHGDNLGISMFCSDDENDSDYESPYKLKRHSMPIFSPVTHNPGDLFGRQFAREELLSAPVFMRDMHHPAALESMVRWMITPIPEDRPTVHQIIECEGPKWVGVRRRAGATVFEGPWGPADEVLTDDAEMIDV